MNTLLQDARHGARQLFHAPGFAAVALAALAIGIGANTAIFSVVNTLLIRPLPYHAPDRLAIIWEHNLPRDRRNNVVAPANYLHWRDLNQTFEEIGAATMTLDMTLTGAGEPVQVPAQYVTAGFFDVLGVQARRGRYFTREEDRPGSRVVVLSDRFWRTRLDADPAVIDRVITLQGQPHTIVGVMPPGFAFLDKDVEVWLTHGLTEAARTPRGRYLTTVGRLKPGVSLEQAQRDMSRVSRELTALFPDFNTGWTARVVPLRDQLTGEIRPALLVMLGAVGVVLLIACANVANLLLARATGRQRELAVRSALGAGRGRIVRQLMAESLVLAIGGGIAGLLLGWWTINLLRAVVAERLPIQRLEAVTIDPSVLAFTIAISLVSGLFFGMVPAVTATGGDLTDALKQGGRTGSASRGSRARAAFVIVEVALALVLLVGAGLLVRSFARLVNVDAGFRPERTITMDVGLPAARYAEPAQRLTFYRRLFERIDALPGVESAGAVTFLPLTGLGSATRFAVVGQPAPPRGEEPVADVRVYTRRYFEAMGIPLVRGRLFDETDPNDATNRIVVNETLANRHWPGQDPIGKRIRVSWNDERDDEIIGVVGDVRHAGLDATPRGMTYWPYTRFPSGSLSLAIRAAGDPRAMVNPVTAIVRDLDPLLAVSDVRTMEEVVSDSVAERRMTMTLLAVFAGAALLLAAVGIYGVIAYNVTQRTQELGIRMALGASRGHVLRMVVGQALALTGVGIALGGAGALAVTRVMEGMLFQVRPGDPVTFAAVAGLLALVAAAASYLPGRRATRVDPVVALRAD